MATVQEIIQIVRQAPDAEFFTGGCATFINIEKGWGFKFYDSRWLRDETYESQKKIARHGLAPEIGRKLSFKLNKVCVYGYLTKTVAVIVDELALDLGTTADLIIDHPDFNPNDEYELYETIEYQTLILELRKLKIDTGDMHWGNVGRSEDGKLMAIDFDIL